jgi:arsenate reductase|tara:strand:- start:384 stop:698 length:315 start_codon:yes stop_codon:yes gene_type:complete
MAEGIARHLGHEAASAGTHPASQVSTHAITVLTSKGIDTNALKPKSVDMFNAEEFDMVISMGCGVSCPTMRIDQDWELEDPVGQSLSVFEQTAQEIERRLKLLE